MKCPHSACSAENLETNLYCGACGAALNADQERIERTVDSAVAKQIKSVRAEFIKESEVCEFKVAERAQERLVDWAKKVLYCIGIPCSLIASVFGFHIADYSKELKKSEDNLKQIEKRVTASSKSLEATLTKDITLAESNLKFQNADYLGAEKLLKEFPPKDPEYEDVFSKVLLCMRSRGDFRAAADYARNNFPAKAERFSTYNDAGYALMAGGIGDPLTLKAAGEMLSEALKRTQGDKTNTQSVYESLALWNAFSHNFPEAKHYLQLWKEITGEKQWSEPSADWFKQIEPAFRDQLRTEVFGEPKV